MMKTSIYTFRNSLVLIGLFVTNYVAAQNGTDSTSMNMDAVYERPFMTSDKAPISIGGYLEANSIYSGEEGVSEGLSFQARRLTMFMYSSFGKNLSFLSEIEFEEGGHEINIEFAAMDLYINSALKIRGGIIMNPIGAFNQNHDGPNWEFIERPNSATQLLPATWSNAGFGLHGKFFKKDWTLGYEAYLTNGFDNNIIDNEDLRTSLPASKDNSERFEESNSGKALFTGKIALKNAKYGELGFSYMGGIYNKFEDDGVTLDEEERRLNVYAIDFSTTIEKTGTSIIGEVAFVDVDVPDTYIQEYGENQFGGFLDIIQPVYTGKVLSWNDAVLNIAVRFDYVDWNDGTIIETGTDIGDELFAFTPAISFRPTKQTVFRANYRHQRQNDFLNNPWAKSASWMFGFSTYF